MRDCDAFAKNMLIATCKPHLPNTGQVSGIKSKFQILRDNLKIRPSFFLSSPLFKSSFLLSISLSNTQLAP